MAHAARRQDRLSPATPASRTRAARAGDFHFDPAAVDEVVRSYSTMIEELDEASRELLKKGVPVRWVGVGPGREQAVIFSK